MVAIGRKVFVTHVFSPSPTPRTTRVVLAATTTTITINTSWVGLGVVAGDVVRLMTGTRKGVAGIVASFSTVNTSNDTINTTLSVAPSVGDSVQVDPPRTATDVTQDVLSIEANDALGDLVQSAVVTLSNAAHQYEGKFQVGDPVEVWIEDGDADTSAVTFPTSTTDDGASSNASRCFVGRIDSIERDFAPEGQVLKLACRDYAADLLDLPYFAIFLARPLIYTASFTVGTSVFETAVVDLNATRGTLKDTAAGKPTFAKTDPDATPITAGITAVDTGFVGESYFDVFARIANALVDSTNEPYKLAVSSFTYKPRSATPGKPTITLQSKTALATAYAPSWALTQGTTVLKADPIKEGTRVRNRINQFGALKDDVPATLTLERVASGVNADGLDILGTDRYGRLEGTSEIRGYTDSAQVLATTRSALQQTSAARERRTIRRVGIIEPGRRVAGVGVTATMADAGLSTPTTVGIVAARTRFDGSGFTTDFDLTHIRPGWDRLLAPPTKSLAVLQKEVWSNYYAYRVVESGDDAIVRRAYPTRFGVTSGDAAEEVLFTIANPGPTPSEWDFRSIKWFDGRLFSLWIKNTASKRFILKTVDAVTGAVLGTTAEADHAFDNNKLYAFDVYRRDKNGDYRLFLLGSYVIAATEFIAAQEWLQDSDLTTAPTNSGFGIVDDAAFAFTDVSGLFARVDAPNGHRWLTFFLRTASELNVFTGEVEGAFGLDILNTDNLAATFSGIKGFSWDRGELTYFAGDNSDASGIKLYVVRNWERGFGVREMSSTNAVGTVALEMVPFAMFYY